MTDAIKRPGRVHEITSTANAIVKDIRRLVTHKRAREEAVEQRKTTRGWTGGGRSRWLYPDQPPSITISWPVTKPDSSDAR